MSFVTMGTWHAENKEIRPHLLQDDCVTVKRRWVVRTGLIEKFVRGTRKAKRRSRVRNFEDVDRNIIARDEDAGNFRKRSILRGIGVSVAFPEFYPLITFFDRRA